MPIKNETFNAAMEVKRIRARRAEARRKLFRKSRLDKYRAELLAMKLAGASCADLVEWLRISHRCKINRSSVDRYLKKLSEPSESIKEESKRSYHDQEHTEEGICHDFDQPGLKPNTPLPKK